MPAKRNEVSYYPEIQTFIEAQLKSNFTAQRQGELEVFWGIGELRANLQRMLRENPEKCGCARVFAQQVPPLDLDIFALVTDGVRFELLILEAKRLKRAGLKEWSQLVGYCLVSGAKYGLLVNIDHGASSRLSELLEMKPHLSHIQTTVAGEAREHRLGFMQWDSLTQSFEYSNLGLIRSLSALSEQLMADF